MIARKPIIVGIDRDGTMIANSGDFPGSKWPNETVIFLPGVIEGLRLLKAKGAKLVMATNQSGPARGKVAVEHIAPYNEHLNELLKKEGASLDGLYSCPHATEEYAANCRKLGYHINKEFIGDCPDWKPAPGMLIKAARDIHDKPLNECTVFMMGDRFLDVETGVNADGVGIFIKTPFEQKQLMAVEELKQRYPDQVHIAEDFLDACQWIARKVS